MVKLLRYLKNYKTESIMGPLFKLTEAIFELIVPIVMSDIIDIGIATGDGAYILRKGALLVFFGFMGLACSLTAQYFAAKASVGFGTELRHDMFAYIMSLSYEELDEMSAATLINRVNVDVNQLQSGVNLGLRLLLRSPFIVIGAVIMSFTIDVRLALISLIATPVIAVVIGFIMNKTIPMHRKLQEWLDNVASISRGNLSGVRVIRAFARQEDEKRRFDDTTDELYRLSVRTGHISALINPLSYALLNLAVVLIIMYGSRHVYEGSVTQGEIIALVNYMSQILLALVAMVNLINSFTKAVASAGRISEIFDPDAVQERLGNDAGREETQDTDVSQVALRDTVAGQAVADDTDASQTAQRDMVAGQAVTGDTAAGREALSGAAVISLQNMSFAYPGSEENSLTDISIDIHRGETIGIIGGTGAGKTTLINLMAGFYKPVSGSLRIGGRDIDEMGEDTLRDVFSIVPQTRKLFKGTIRDNLCFGREADDEELERALKISQAAEFVNRPGIGLDYMLEQGGTNLSGGQQQRLTIARALVRTGEVLILDDSASALDFATDAALRKSLREGTEGLTVIVVSQRIGSIMHADRILVLDDGRQAGLGTHEELLESCEIYREIYDSQTR